MSKHTPGPYFTLAEEPGRIYCEATGARIAVCDADDGHVNPRCRRKLPQAENARFIVRAVNAHEALVAACERALAVETSTTQVQERELRIGYLATLRAAIALAKPDAAKEPAR